LTAPVKKNVLIFQGGKLRRTGAAWCTHFNLNKRPDNGADEVALSSFQFPEEGASKKGVEWEKEFDWEGKRKKANLKRKVLAPRAPS